MRRFAKSVYGSYRTAGSNPALSVQKQPALSGRLILYWDDGCEPALAAQQTISGFDAEGAAQRIPSIASTAWRLKFPTRQAVGCSLPLVARIPSIPSTAWRRDWHRETVAVLVCILGLWVHGAVYEFPPRR